MGKSFLFFCVICCNKPSNTTNNQNNPTLLPHRPRAQLESHTGPTRIQLQYTFHYNRSTSLKEVCVHQKSSSKASPSFSSIGRGKRAKFIRPRNDWSSYAETETYMN